MWLALALVLSAALAVWRCELLVRAFLPDWIALKREMIAQDTAIRSSGPQREAIPADLEAIALQETEGWAREQVRAAIMDAYEATQDWDSVRTQYYGARE